MTLHYISVNKKNKDFPQQILTDMKCQPRTKNKSIQALTLHYSPVCVSSDKCAEIYTLYLHYHYFLDLKYFLFKLVLVCFERKGMLVSRNSSVITSSLGTFLHLLIDANKIWNVYLLFQRIFSASIMIL